MKRFLYILALLLSPALTGRLVHAQTDPFRVCPGQPNVRYTINSTPGSTYHWQLPVGASISYANASRDTIEVYWNIREGDYILSVYEETPSGCLGDLISTTVTVKPSLKLFDEAGGTYYRCDGDDVTLSAIPMVSYRWQDNSTASEYLVRQTEDIELIAYDDEQCAYRSAAHFIYYNNPYVNIGQDTFLCGESYMELNAGSYASYRWSNGSEDQIITIGPGNFDWYTVEVTDINGCKGYDTLLISPCDLAKTLGDFQNYITPNGDNDHETWVIENLHKFGKARVEIFDRQGRLVHKFDNEVLDEKTELWDGRDMKTGSIVPMDSYYFIITVPQSGTVPVTGNITVIR